MSSVITFYDLSQVAEFLTALDNQASHVEVEVVYHKDTNTWVCHIFPGRS